MKALAPAVLACLLLAGTALLTGANAQSAQTPALHTASDRPTDVSTAKRQRRSAVRRYSYYGYVAPAYSPPAYRPWYGADPTWGPGTPLMREYQAMGRCVIDEGYGRFTFCSNH